MASDAATSPPQNRSASRRLESWKEVAVYLNRTVRTVQRWEREQGLPVHRLQHNKQSSVFAYAAEIDHWWDERRVSLEAERPDGSQGSEHAPDSRGQGEEAVAPGAVRWPWTRVGAWGLTLTVAAAVIVWLASVYSAAAGAAESQRLYRDGRELWKQRTPAGFQQALLKFEQSIAADTDNAHAHAGLADTHALLEAFGIVSAADALPKAHAAATRAVELAPDLGEAHASLAFVLWEQNNRSDAMRQMERAIALDPRYATARHWYALFLQDSGRYQDAVREGQAARALDPASPVIGSDLAIMLRNAGKPLQALALLEDLVLENPTFAGHRHGLSEAYRRAGHFDRALEQMNYAVKLGDVRPATLARLAWLQAKNGIRRAALDASRRLRTMHDQGVHVAPPVMVEALAAAGDFDSAFRLIGDALQQGATWVVELTTHHESDVYGDLKNDPRWSVLEPRLRVLAARVVRDTVESRPAPDPPGR